MTTTLPTTTPELRGAPVLGHVVPLLRRPLEFLRSTRAHGDVVRIRLGAQPTFVVNDHNLIRQMLLGDVAKFDRGVQAAKARPVLGNGILISDGAFHRSQRRLMQPAFHHRRIAGYTDVMARCSVEKTDSWQDGQRLAMDSELRSLTLTVVTKTLFSTELGDGAAVEFDRSLPIVLRGIIKRVFMPDFYEKIPLPSNLRFNAALGRMRGLINSVIQDYRTTGRDTGDLLSMLLQARDEETGSGMTDRQLHDEVMTILVAGAESTANALSWACHLLGENPEAQRRLQAEADAVLGGRRVAGHTDIPALEYTRLVLTETLRMYPPAFMLSRRAVVDVELGGHRIPAGSAVLFSPYAVQHDPEIYPDPDRFDPDRWVGERGRAIPRPAFLAFIAGQHACIGEAFAWTEMAVVLSAIASRWEIRPAPGKPVRPIVKGTIVPDKLPMVVHRRRRT